MEQGVALAFVANRHVNHPATMVDAIRATLSLREEVAAPIAFTPAVEAEELVAA